MMSAELQAAQSAWPTLTPFVFVPHAESEYQRLVSALDDLIDVVGFICTGSVLRTRKMTNVTEIQQAVLALPETEYIELRQWFSELDRKKWDRQIEGDSKAGKLDFLISKDCKDK